MSLNNLSERMYAMLGDIDNAKNGDIGPTLEKVKAKCGVIKHIIDTEKVKVEQAKVLVAAGLRAEVGGIMFIKDGKDSHPKLLGK